MQVRILEPIGPNPEVWQRISHADVRVRDTRGEEDKNLISFASDADVLVLSSRPLSAHVLGSCPNLKCLIVAFSGLDHIDLATCQKRGIKVKNTPGYATHAVAEHTLALALRLLREERGQELLGKTVGVVGGGPIGQEVARLFAAFGCTILLWHHRPLETAYTQVSLDELLKKSSLVSLHIPLKQETARLINRERLALMQPESYLLNVARAGVVDQEALIEALEQDRLSGAALDVYIEDPRLRRDNVVLTPHIGFQTKEALARREEMALAYLKEWIAKKSQRRALRVAGGKTSPESR